MTRAVSSGLEQDFRENVNFARQDIRQATRFRLMSQKKQSFTQNEHKNNEK